MNKKRIKKVLQKVAKQEGISVEELRSEIAKSIKHGMKNQDPQVQTLWKELSLSGSTPVTEDIIIALCQKLIKI